MSLGTSTVVELEPQDNIASVRRRLGWLDPGRVALVLPWELRFLSRDLDFDLLRRVAERRQLETAIVSPDPARRGLARASGFPAFSNVRDAQETAVWRNRAPEQVTPPRQHWWEDPVDLRPRSARAPRRWLQWGKLALRIVVFLLAIAVLAGGAYVIVPSAEITLLPAGQEFTTIVPVSADPDTEAVDQVAHVVPARRVGVEVEGYSEVKTTGIVDVAVGKTTGEVLFTNLLAQDYTVPAGTVVRTSSTSYPVRFRTTADVAVPAAGQATVPVEALETGVGNVGAFQINRVEGVAASAVRVINPQATWGAEPTEKHIVTRADYDRARSDLIRQLLEQAHVELGALDLLLPTEFVPRQSLRVEAVPKEAYSRFIGEQADVVGLNMRLLVSGLAVDVDNAEVIAYAALSRRLPPGYTLVDARFDVGEVAEEDIGPGKFTLFVTAHAYAAAMLDTDTAIELIGGQRVAEAHARLMERFPLAKEPQIKVWPERLDRLPLLPMRITVEVVPETQAADRVSLAEQ